MNFNYSSIGSPEIPTPTYDILSPLYEFPPSTDGEVASTPPTASTGCNEAASTLSITPTGYNASNVVPHCSTSLQQHVITSTIASNVFSPNLLPGVTPILNAEEAQATFFLSDSEIVQFCEKITFEDLNGRPESRGTTSTPISIPIPGVTTKPIHKRFKNPKLPTFENRLIDLEVSLKANPQATGNKIRDMLVEKWGANNRVFYDTLVYCKQNQQDPKIKVVINDYHSRKKMNKKRSFTERSWTDLSEILKKEGLIKADVCEAAIKIWGCARSTVNATFAKWRNEFNTPASEVIKIYDSLPSMRSTPLPVLTSTSS